MTRILSIGLLVAGVILLILGVAASDSFSSEVSEAVQGTPSNRAIWLLVGGALCGVAGFAGLTMRRAK